MELLFPYASNFAFLLSPAMTHSHSLSSSQRMAALQAKHLLPFKKSVWDMSRTLVGNYKNVKKSKVMDTRRHTTVNVA